MSGISRLGARFGAVVAAQLAFIAAGMAAAPAVLAASSTLHVGGSNCSSSGPGTSTSPYCTISQAAAVAAAGQTVLVAPGTYPERVSPPRSGTAGSPIVYQAASGGTVTVNSSTTGISTSGRSYVTIDGFNIFDTVGIGISVSSSSNIVISNNTVSYAGTPASGQVATGISLNNTSNSTVTGNYTHHNSDSGIYLSNGSTGNVVSYNESSFNARQYQRNANGINVVAPGNTITGNVLHDNEDSGLQFYPGGDNNVATVNVSYGNGDHGIDDLNVTGGRLIGNTIYHNCTSGINVEGSSGTGNTVTTMYPSTTRCTRPTKASRARASPATSRSATPPSARPWSTTTSPG